MKNKVFGFALFLLISAAGVWAQNLPSFPGSSPDVNSIWSSSLWSSPQSTVTEGRYRGHADNFIRPDQFTGLRLNRWFGMTSFLYNNTSGAVATAGVAVKPGKVYIGAFYTGNFWAGKPGNNYTEEEMIPAGGVAGEIYNVYNNINVATGPVNNFAVLFGVSDFGIRLTYRTNYQSFKKKDIVTAGQLYSNYKLQSGYIAPQIAFAVAKDLTKNGIRPYFTFDLVFYREYQETETTGPDNNGNTGTYIGRSSNHVDPSFGLGLGGYTFLSTENGFRLSADLDYVLAFNIYNNKYSYVENNEYKTGKIKGTYSPGSNPFIEQSFVSNVVTPSLSGQWSTEKIALRFKLNLPLTFNSKDQNSMAMNSSGGLDYNGASNSTFTFIFRPDLRLAMQYKVVPDKFTLNAGARIQATAVTLDTIKQTTYNNGDKVRTTKTHNKNYSNTATSTQFISRFSVGPTFNFTENVWVEAATGVSNVNGDGAIDVFAPGGLFAFGSILVGLKF